MRKFLAVLIVITMPVLGLANDQEITEPTLDTVVIDVDQVEVPETVINDDYVPETVIDDETEVQETIEAEVLGDVQETESFDLMGIGIGLLLALSLAITYLLRFRKSKDS